MKCPYCGGETWVVYGDDQEMRNLPVYQRRRECRACGKSKRFTTREAMVSEPQAEETAASPAAEVNC